MSDGRAAALAAGAPRRAACLLLAAVAFLPGALAAHPFFVEPTDFAPRTGELIGLPLWVGHPPDPQPMPRVASHLASFTVTDALGTRAVAGVEGIHPAGYLRTAERGAVVVTYRSRAVSHELPVDKFEEYLAEEGQAMPPGGVLASSAGGLVHEEFARCAKALVAVGGALDAAAETTSGCELELVPVLRDGEVVAARLLLRGRPLPGARVLAMSLEGSAPDLELRTDQGGSVALPALGEPIVLHAVQAEPIPAAAAPHAAMQVSAAGVALDGPAASEAGPEWRSAWASLALRLPPAPATEPGSR